MKYSFKKISSLLLVLAISMSLLAGCGTSNDNDNTNDNNTNNNTTNDNNTNDNTTNDNTTNDNTTNDNNTTGQGTATGVKAGTYTSSAQGYKSTVTVTVTVADDGSISDISVDASGETPDLGGKAAPTISKSVLEKQSLAVDTVSGATVTSKAVLAALEDALTQAGADVNTFKK